MALALATNWALVSAVVAVLLVVLLLLLLPHPAAANPRISTPMIAIAASRLGRDRFWSAEARSGWGGWGIGLLWFLPGPCCRPNAVRCPAVWSGGASHSSELRSNGERAA